MSVVTYLQRQRIEKMWVQKMSIYRNRIIMSLFAPNKKPMMLNLLTPLGNNCGVNSPSRLRGTSTVN